VFVDGLTGIGHDERERLRAPDIKPCKMLRQRTLRCYLSTAIRYWTK